MEDGEPLIEPAPSSRWSGRRSSVCCLALLLLGVLGLIIAISITYWLSAPGGKGPFIKLKVMALNTWGMPASLGSYDKALRMEAIGRLIAKEEYDVYLLSELWMRPDHKVIKSLVPQGYHMTEIADFVNPHQMTGCDGVIGPDGCSGLAIVSRLNLTEIEFWPYSDHGNLFWLDGEYFARKGVGRVRVEPHPNVTVDVFVTHTCANDYNYYYRQRQIKELVRFVNRSDADFVILGGDFNVDPKVNENESSYHDIKHIMKNSIEEFFNKLLERWLSIPSKASYANPNNTYSANIYKPVLYDYIFHKAKGKNIILTDWFHIPFLKTLKLLQSNETAAESLGSATHTQVSLSDHEAVTANLLLWK